MARPSRSKPSTGSEAKLAKYRSMRDFGATPEPSGTRRVRPKKALRFVVQKHRASRLHYDFRLEAGGVLLSWAIPKGPSMNPADKRLAMQTEDHPLDYYDFEGVIPEGNYGAGEVIVWDCGTYELLDGDDVEKAVRAGKLKIRLHGKKLRGVFTLVRMHGRGAKDERAWILIKDKSDGLGDPNWSIDDYPESVKTGATVEDIAADPKARAWGSDREAKTKTKAVPRAARQTARVRVRDLKLPTIKRPELATLIDAPFDDPDWLFEIKWDGIRAIAAVDAHGEVRITSRNGKDLLERFPELSRIGDAFTERPVLVDGEIVALDDEGRSSFQRLQRSRSEPQTIRYVVFDALFAHGRDLRNEPLEERKRILESILRPGDPLVVYSQHVIGVGKKLYALAKERGLEGIIGKRRDSRYVEKRTRDWVKIKVKQSQECVIGGYTEPQGSRSGFGSLVCGVHEEGTTKLRYVGHVGTGFDAKTIAALYARLKKLETDESPFSERIPRRGTAIHWVKPVLVAQVSFTEWTADGRMRHPTFEGLREDKPASEVVRERAEPPPTNRKKRSR